MFIILLEFAENKAKAKDFMDGHKTWLQKGFDDGVFLLSGSLKTVGGGGVIAHGVTFEEITTYVNEDPFVQEGIVSAEIIGLEASKADDRLTFLL